MSNTVYYYKIWCNTDSQYEYVWAEDEPTACPVNNSHSVDLSSISIGDTVSTERVKIIEENISTGENYMCECHTITYATGAGSVTATDFSWPFPISVLDLQLVTRTENIQDEIQVCVAPDTIVGIIAADAATGATGAVVSSTVIDNSMIGYYVSITDGVSLHECGRIVSVDSANSKISWETPTIINFAAASPTYVRLTVYVVNDYSIGPPSRYVVGEGKIGGSHVPANTTVRVLLTNTDGSQETKLLSTQIEYLY